MKKIIAKVKTPASFLEMLASNSLWCHYMAFNDDTHEDGCSEDLDETNGGSSFLFLNPTYTPLFFYFLVPLFAGLLFSCAGIDIAAVAVRHINLLAFLEKAGVEIQTKSMCYIIYLEAAPCLFCYFLSVQAGKRFRSYLQTLAASRLILLSFGVLLTAFMFYVTVFNGPPAGEVVATSETRFLLAWAQSDISFALYAGFMIMAITTALYAQWLICTEFLFRFNK